MKLNIFQIIKEEINNYFSDWESIENEPSVLDKYYDKKTGSLKQPSPNKKIDAELIGFITNQFNSYIKEPIGVYLNPKNLKGFSSDTKGILLNNGNLYLAESYIALHEDILKLLSKHGIILFTSIEGYDKKFPSQFVAVVRVGNLSMFGQSSAYDYFPEQYIDIFNIGNQKQPFEFINYNYDN